MLAGPLAKTLQSRGPWLASRLSSPAGSSLTMASCAPLDPSCRFMDYAAGLCPSICSGLGSRGSPIYSACLCPRAVFRTPMDPAVALGCFFTARSGLRRICTGSASTSPHRRFSCGRVTRLQIFLYGTARELACPSPPRTFTFELSPPESPLRDVEYHYAGKQPFPAAGLSPARHAALWAASR